MVTQALDSKDPVHKEFWDALADVAEAEYREALHTEEADRGHMRGEPEPQHQGEVGLHSAMDNDIQVLLAGMRMGQFADYLLPWIIASLPEPLASPAVVGTFLLTTTASRSQTASSVGCHCSPQLLGA